jgi:hypothetical protein
VSLDEQVLKVEVALGNDIHPCVIGPATAVS